MDITVMTATSGCGRRGGSRPLGFPFSLADGTRERMRMSGPISLPVLPCQAQVSDCPGSRTGVRIDSRVNTASRSGPTQRVTLQMSLLMRPNAAVANTPGRRSGEAGEQQPAPVDADQPA
ncbi:hypothetical protein GCM10010317_103390 [Streptomyces mirabilis]|nr:hypothetical protein GCM10010317_103390 [Streptomyces mirabilis]